MPADVFYESSSQTVAATEAAAPRRLPLGVGLMVAATISVGLWFGVAAGVKALFF